MWLLGRERVLAVSGRMVSRGVIRMEGGVLAGSTPHYQIDVLRELHCPRKISSPYHK